MLHDSHSSDVAPLRSTGFSLVELLVVIGIIALLIAMLMPALTAVNERAKNLQCQTLLRSMGQAAYVHVNDHNGYLPTAGRHWDLPGDVADPETLGDNRLMRYTYYTDNGKIRPVPVTVALGIEMGVKFRLDSRENLEADMQREGFRKHFRCPSQLVAMSGVTQADSDWIAPHEWSSYIFNEAILGHREKDTNPDPPRGKLTKIKTPTVVMFATDGRPRESRLFHRLLVPDSPGGRDTLWSFYLLGLRDPINFGSEGLDFLRHRYRTNVLFVDGHVEAVPMTEAGLSTVGVSSGR